MSTYVARATLPTDLDDFTRGYLECAEWAGLDDEAREALELSVSPKWEELSILLAVVECGAFQRDNASDLAGQDESRAGHDFYLTRNYHGAGFWDSGDYPDAIGRRLTDAAHAYGTADVLYDEDAELLSLY